MEVMVSIRVEKEMVQRGEGGDGSDGDGTN